MQVVPVVQPAGGQGHDVVDVLRGCATRATVRLLAQDDLATLTPLVAVAAFGRVATRSIRRLVALLRFDGFAAIAEARRERGGMGAGSIAAGAWSAVRYQAAP